MNGRIFVESKLGKGSVFKIEIDNVEVGNYEKRLLKDFENHDNIIFEESKILVVDDDYLSADFIRIYLNKIKLSTSKIQHSRTKLHS